MKKKQTRELEVAFSRGENKCTVKVQICFAQHSTLAIESWQGIARGILLVKLLIKGTSYFVLGSIYIFIYLILY